MALSNAVWTSVCAMGPGFGKSRVDVKNSLLGLSAFQAERVVLERRLIW